MSSGAEGEPRLELLEHYLDTRRLTLRLCEPLEIEDYVVQPMADASPPKWHLGHTTWFFERAILSESRDYVPYDATYYFLFNSYYNSFGPQWRRNARGVLSRPTVAEVIRYRREIDERVELFLRAGGGASHAAPPLVELGINHEQQHQELLLTDLKATFAQCPLFPAYVEPSTVAATRSSDSHGRSAAYTQFAGGQYEIGHRGAGFAYDNETPSHRVLLGDFEIQNRLVTNGEFLEFINDGGYKRPELWLSDGWDTVQQQGWDSPLYCIFMDGTWCVYTLAGLQLLDVAAPVCHVSFYEADAFARWKGLRLPTEAEWEVAAGSLTPDEAAGGSFLESRRFHPQPDETAGLRLCQMFGEAWQWTASAYLPYPGFRPLPGPLGEYNGKFMNNQYVLRGGSCATPKSHIRRTYRNFFQPDKRWQFTGIRLAR
jgi:ergothioneine biosynthesis protein EgtB